MSIGDTVFLGDGFHQRQDALISPFDRGYLFAHAAYEVTAVYNGQLIDITAHMERLARTLKALDIPMPGSGEDLIALHEEIIARNQLKEGAVYLQVSAGDEGVRDFAGGDVFTPTLFLFTTEKTLIDTETAREGIAVTLIEDTRWARRDLKTTQLLSQALAYRAAARQGAQSAWMHEGGKITEAASANAWIVKDSEVITRDLTPAILPGVTRRRVVDLLKDKGYRLTERAFTPDEAQNADEAFTTSSGAMVAPVISIEAKTIGTGTPGPVTRLIQRLYFTHIGVDIDAELSWLRVK